MQRHFSLCRAVVGLVALATSSPCLALTAGIPLYELAGGTSTAEYADITKNEVQDRTGEQKDIKMTGTWYRLGARLTTYGLEIEGRNYRPQDLDYWQKRDELYITLHYYEIAFPWLAPIVGYHTATQTGDKDHVDAPPAFLDNNEAFILGFRANFVPFSTLGGHGLLVQARVSYLTTFEKDKNFGTDAEVKLGYVYQLPTMEIGLTAGQIRSFANTSVQDVNDKLKYNHVRSTQVTNVYGFFLHY